MEVTIDAGGKSFGETGKLLSFSPIDSISTLQEFLSLLILLTIFLSIMNLLI